MSKRRTTKYEHGDRYQVYINRTVDDELLSFINKQSDISGASMLGLILLYQLYGMNDIDDLLPRNYRVNAKIAGFNSEALNSFSNNVPKSQITTLVNEQVENVDIKRVEEEPTNTRLEDKVELENASLVDNVGLDTEIEITEDNIPSPVQIEESPKENEKIADSKGKGGLSSINTSSMMIFGQMSKPKKDN